MEQKFELNKQSIQAIKKFYDSLGNFGITHKKALEELENSSSQFKITFDEDFAITEDDGYYFFSYLNSHGLEKAFKLLPSELQVNLSTLTNDFYDYFEILDDSFLGHVYCYDKITPPALYLSPDFEFKELDSSYAEFVFNTYSQKEHTSVEEIGKMLDKMSFGSFKNSEICGYISMHDDGTFGVLEVFDKFRGNNLGYTLEAYAIKRLLEMKILPLCFVNVNNAFSIDIQEKLGMTRLEKKQLYGKIRKIQ